MKGLKDMLTSKNGGSPLSLTNGADYSVAGRSKSDMSDVNGTIHNQYSLTGDPAADSISARWLGQFGSTINIIPQPTSVQLSGAGTIDSNKYLDNMPEG